MQILCALLLCLSVMLGGGTRAGFPSDTILQLACLPLVFAMLVPGVLSWRRGRTPASPPRAALVWSAAIVSLPLLQLVPLPMALVATIAPNTTVAQVQALLDLAPTYRTLSVAPFATALSAVSLLPAVVLFLGVSSLSASERQRLSLVLIALAVGSVLLGLLQLAQGPTSALRPFAFTNTDDAVGLFANRNHLSALLLSGIVVAAAWLPMPSKATAKSERSLVPLGLAPSVVSAIMGGVVFVLLAGQAMTRSRAGIALTVLALPLAAFAVAPGRALFAGQQSRRLLLGAVLILALTIFEFAAMRVVDRFMGDPLHDSRLPFARNTMAAAIAYMPFGAGVGTFTTVYPQFPKVSDESVGAFANRAHSDALEFWLEGGVLAIGLTLAFLIWLGRRAVAVWGDGTADVRSAGEARQTRLAKAAALVVLLLLLHSLVDYPLRTAALGAVFAFAGALLVPPPSRRRAVTMSATPASKAR